MEKLKDKELDVVEEKLSPWYAFCSTGCGFCKKAEPVIEELNKEGYDILVLDIAEPDNKKLNEELKKEYGVQCGTPWFINADTGKGVCGFREKDMLELWLDGKDVPEPPRPSGPPPKIPFQGSTNKQELNWKKEYKKWLNDNKHMPEDWHKRQKSANDIIDGQRPKSDPPRIPNMTTASDIELDKWAEDSRKWQLENKHLPNLPNVDNMLRGMKNRRDQMASQKAGNTIPPQLENRLSSLETKVDKLISHLGVK